MENSIKQICIFCGSRFGNNPAYKEMAHQTGLALVRRGIHLVYGGGNVGLMGEVAGTVMDAGGHVSGIIPGFLEKREVALSTVQHLEIVPDMHIRKRRFLELSDAFLVMPGGIGTFEELTEVISWFGLGLHTKPIGFLDVDGYFNTLFAMFEHAVKEGFMDQDLLNRLHRSPDIEVLIDLLQANPGDPVINKHYT